MNFMLQPAKKQGVNLNKIGPCLLMLLYISLKSSQQTEENEISDNKNLHF